MTNYIIQYVLMPLAIEEITMFENNHDIAKPGKVDLSGVDRTKVPEENSMLQMILSPRLSRNSKF